MKAIIADVTGSILVTCYSPQAHSLLPPITKLLSYADPNPYKLPAIIKDLEHTKRKFVLHFAKGSRKRFPRFILDDAKDADPPMLPPFGTVQPLLALTAAPSSTEEATSSKNTTPTGDETRLTQMSSPDTPTPAQETYFSEILTDILTPPPASTEPSEKIQGKKQTETSSARKQLFESSEDKDSMPATKKVKKAEDDPQE